MAHFAELDASNNVLRVIVVHDSLESQGAQWCHDTFGGTWIQCSYNARIRKNYPGAGFTYDPTRDAFIPPQPFPSWTLDEATCRWNPPVPMPDDGQAYVWDESQQAWTAVEMP